MDTKLQMEIGVPISDLRSVLASSTQPLAEMLVMNSNRLE